MLRRFLSLPLMFCVCWIVCLAHKPATAQILNDIRQDVRDDNHRADDHDEDDDDDDDHHHRNHHHYHDDCDDFGFNEFAGQLFFYTVTSPIWLPRQAIGDTTLFPGRFVPYPYADEYPGLVMDDCGDMGWNGNWLVRPEFQYSNDFDSVDILSGRLLVESASRFGFQLKGSYFHEDVTPTTTDQFWIGDANFVFRFAQSPCFQSRCGVGFGWFSDNIGSEFGFNFHYGTDWFPARPWVVSTEIDLGRLGSASKIRARGTLGIQLSHLEIFSGYEVLDIESTTIDGLVAGIRLWY